jgi:hypothetical protein
MKTIIISDATHQAIQASADLPFHSDAKRQPDGTWLVPLQDEAFEYLRRVRLPGETDDDTVIRLIRLYRGQRPS